MRRRVKIKPKSRTQHTDTAHGHSTRAQHTGTAHARTQHTAHIHRTRTQHTDTAHSTQHSGTAHITQHTAHSTQHTVAAQTAAETKPKSRVPGVGLRFIRVCCPMCHGYLREAVRLRSSPGFEVPRITATSRRRRTCTCTDVWASDAVDPPLPLPYHRGFPSPYLRPSMSFVFLRITIHLFTSLWSEGRGWG